MSFAKAQLDSQYEYGESVEGDQPYLLRRRDDGLRDEEEWPSEQEIADDVKADASYEHQFTS